MMMNSDHIQPDARHMQPDAKDLQPVARVVYLAEAVQRSGTALRNGTALTTGTATQTGSATQTATAIQAGTAFPAEEWGYRCTMNSWMKLYKNIKYGLLVRVRLVLLSLCGLLMLVSCKKEEGLENIGNIPGLGGDKWEKGPIDHWIYDSLTKPYNIAVKYKWDQFELELNKTIVPPREEKVIPVMEAVKKVWINAYVKEAGELFFRQYAPKFFVLAGSAVYNTDGSITLGTAEGGRKVVLYVLNEFRMKGMPGFTPADSVTIKQLFHSIEHEFGHILHQHVLYPDDFKRICAGLYSANWNNTNDVAAIRDGFVSAYAMSAPDEDFVEMIATMLVEGRQGFERMINSIPAGSSINGTSQVAARSKLRQKESTVVAYFKDVWQIDLYGLQATTRSAIDSLIK